MLIERGKKFFFTGEDAGKMSRNDILQEVRRLEERLTYADPGECAKITKKLVRLKNGLACGK